MSDIDRTHLSCQRACPIDFIIDIVAFWLPVLVTATPDVTLERLLASFETRVFESLFGAGLHPGFLKELLFVITKNCVSILICSHSLHLNIQILVAGSANGLKFVVPRTLILDHFRVFQIVAACHSPWVVERLHLDSLSTIVAYRARSLFMVNSSKHFRLNLLQFQPL